MSHLGGIFTPLSSCFRSAAYFDSCLTSPSHCCTCKVWDTESAATMPAMDWDTWRRQINLIDHNRSKNDCVSKVLNFQRATSYKAAQKWTIINAEYLSSLWSASIVTKSCSEKAKMNLTLSLTTSGIEGRSSDVTSCLSGNITTFISSSYWSCSTSNPPSIPGWIQIEVGWKRDALVLKRWQYL